MFWKDLEFQVLGSTVDELWKLREQPEAIIRVMRYAIERLGLPCRLVVSQQFKAPMVERCEEIEPMTFIG